MIDRLVQAGLLALTLIIFAAGLLMCWVIVDAVLEPAFGPPGRWMASAAVVVVSALTWARSWRWINRSLGKGTVGTD